ncbi:hypothetical protein ACFC36_01910 [Streptomyces rubiginosohelvolus]|uniref:hypothetical protein n=1 Tax=Streptomyces rubiginosohelvolus TaxID=67362 RepID=UPI0035D539FD
MTADAEAPERNRFLEAVGRVTLAGAQLDFSLRSLLGAIAFEPTLLMYANAEGTARLIDLCKLALKVGTVAPEDMTEIEACLARANDLRIKRNTVVHSMFMQAEDGDGFEAMKPISKGLGVSVSILTIVEMEATAQAVEELRLDMFRAGWNARCADTGMARMPHPTTAGDSPV